MTPRLGRLANCEREFAQLVTGFISSIAPSERRHAEFICRSWAGQWAQNMPGTALNAGTGFQELLNEGARSFWRSRYYANRDKVLEALRRRRGSRPPRIVACTGCGQEFQQLQVNSHFCSKRCYCAWWRANRDKGDVRHG